MLVPKLFSTLRGYTRSQFTADLLSGTVVGIIAIPLAIAFAIASGVSPDKGLITAIIAGFLISFLGGSRVQIGGPTGAFVVIVYAIVEKHGVDGLAVATIVAGVILVVLGLLKFGSLIKFIPHPLVVGFTSGIAMVILASQVKDFLGLSLEKVPSEFIDKVEAFAATIGTTNPAALAIALGSVLIIVFWKHVSQRIPGSLVALVLGTAVVHFFELPVETIGSRFGTIASSIPAPALPAFDWARIGELAGPIFAIAMLGGIESLLSAVVADGMIGSRHRSNMELVAQGVANIVTPLFGGIPATGAIARTAANVKNGGRTPVAGIVHAVVLLLVLLFLGQLAKLVPLACLAAVLVVVAYNMSDWRSFVRVFRSTRSGATILMATFLLTVLVDLTVAIAAGMGLAALFFLRRMVESAGVQQDSFGSEYDPNDPDSIDHVALPESVESFEINGPLFFGVVDKFRQAILFREATPKVYILRMRHVPMIDASGVHAVEEFIRESRKSGAAVLVSGLQPAVRDVLEKARVLELLGPDNDPGDIHAATNRAREILGIRTLTLAELLRRGGLHDGIPAGETRLETVRNAFMRIPLPAGFAPDTVLQHILDREMAAPTAIGRGFAVPHAVRPQLRDADQEMVALCRLERPQDWQALDGEPVHTLFVILDSRPKRHLEILALIAKELHDPEFIALLSQGTDLAGIIGWLERFESGRQ